VTQLFGGDLPVSVFSVVESRVDMDSGMVPSEMPPDTYVCDYTYEGKKEEGEEERKGRNTLMNKDAYSSSTFKHLNTT
jgi:hypothetical protein